jgi:hypothetical protein
MAKKPATFRIDERVKDALTGYCDERGLKQERVVEALLYSFLQMHKPTEAEIASMIRASHGSEPKQIPLPASLLRETDEDLERIADSSKSDQPTRQQAGPQTPAAAASGSTSRGRKKN